MEPRISIADYAKSRGITPGRYTGVEAASIRKGYEAYSRAYDVKMAQSQAETSVNPEIRDVPNPDGRGATRMAKLSNGSWQILPEYKAPEMRMTQADDGTIILVDPVTGANFPSYNKDTGGSVKGAKKLDPFAFLGGEPQQQSRPVAQSGAATLEPPMPAPAPAPISQPSSDPMMAPAPSPSAPATTPEAPTVYSISGEADYAKVPAGSTVSWNGQTFIKR
jgi:hypothetical protein